MPKYLWQVAYTPQGAQGLLKDTGSGRRAVAQRMVEQAGGKLEAFYFAVGKWDVYAIVDLPDVSTAAAISLTVNAAGAVHLRSTALLTPEEMDAATGRTIEYRPPGAGSR
jgi:uncharacterized protein with GYD domain